MQRVLILVVALIAACAWAAPFSYDNIPAEYKELVPPEVKEILEGLTDEDKAIIKEFYKDHAKYKDEAEALEALKAKSPSLYEKAKKLHDLVKDKLAKLSGKPKELAEKVIQKVRELQKSAAGGQKPTLDQLKADAKSFLAEYEALSAEDKAQLKEHFPILSGIVSNEKFQKLAKGFLGNN